MDSYGEVDDDYIKIAEEEGSEFMEFPKEDNTTRTLTLSTIQAQFPNAIGLKYRGPSGAWRALRAVDNVLEAPKGGWGDTIYCLTVAETNKRKTDYGESYDETKKSRLNPLLQDMAVLNLPFEVTEDELREYFEKHFGDLEYCEVKKFRDTGKSRGYGFIRFKDESSAKDAVSKEHHMHGRKIDVKLKQQKPMKLFIGRLPDGTTDVELKDYFSKFGDLADVYIPTPFRNFAFVTYSSQEEGRNVLHESHALNGVRLNVQERNQDTKGNRGDSDDRDKFNTNTESRSSNYSHNRNDSSYDRLGNNPGGSLPSQQNPNMDPALKNMLLQYLAGQ